MKLAPIALSVGLLAAIGGAVVFMPSSAADEAATKAEPVAAVQDDDPVIAKVGDAELRVSELAAQAQLIGANLNMLPEEQRQSMLLDMAISTHLGAIAARRAGVDKSDEYKDAIAVIERQMLYSVWLQQVSEDVASDDKVDAALKDGKYDIAIPVEISARHILVETEEKGQGLIKMLKDGGDFATLAAEHSTGPSGATGGGLGWFREGQMVKPFSDAAFAMEVGTVSQAPVQTQFGWHVIEVQDRRTREDEVKEDIANRLLGEALEAQLGTLREEVGVTFVTPDDTDGDAAAN